jgi:hypothetical protein
MPGKRYKTSSAGAQQLINDPTLEKTDPGFKEELIERERCRKELEKFCTHMAMRDQLVRDAIAAGISDYEIEAISGLARSTIRRIDGRAD